VDDTVLIIFRARARRSKNLLLRRDEHINYQTGTTGHIDDPILMIASNKIEPTAHRQCFNEIPEWFGSPLIRAPEIRGPVFSFAIWLLCSRAKKKR
jgi:hypothetical protein